MNSPARLTLPVAANLPRADGALRLSSKQTASGSRLSTLFQRGALKAVFPRSAKFTGVVVNTSGGVTGGDKFQICATAETGSDLTLTTQAAERAYRAIPGQVGRVRTQLEAKSGASLRWLPQETILFDGCNLDRELRIDVEETSEVLLVEPMIFGRAAMGEREIAGSVRDRIELAKNGQTIHLDQWRLDGDLTHCLARPAVADGDTAMASLIYFGLRAEHHLEPLRALMPESGGASLKHENLLVARILAKDGYQLRKSLLPILDHLTRGTLPTCWRL
jgi:urease accessory protein